MQLCNCKQLFTIKKVTIFFTASALFLLMVGKLLFMHVVNPTFNSKWLQQTVAQMKTTLNRGWTKQELYKQENISLSITVDHYFRPQYGWYVNDGLLKLNFPT